MDDPLAELNVAPSAVRDLLLTKESRQWNARGGGVPMDVYAPMSAVMGIYARENGQGMIFDSEADPPEPPAPPAPTGSDGPKAASKSGIQSIKPKKKSSLRLVK